MAHGKGGVFIFDLRFGIYEATPLPQHELTSEGSEYFALSPSGNPRHPVCPTKIEAETASPLQHFDVSTLSLIVNCTLVSNKLDLLHAA